MTTESPRFLNGNKFPANDSQNITPLCLEQMGKKCYVSISLVIILKVITLIYIFVNE